MGSLQPVGLYGLEVPPGDILVPISSGFPATIRITMAAIDPTEELEDEDENGAGPSTKPIARSTLKLVKQAMTPPDDDDEDEDDEELRNLLLGGGSDSEDDDEDDEDDDEAAADGVNGKLSRKQRQTAALKKLLENVEEDEDEEDSDEDMDVAPQINGINGKSAKGKGKEKMILAEAEEEDDDEEDSEDGLDGLDMETFVVCTLDTDRNYQQPIDITVGDDEKAFFIVSGPNSIHLTGNYVIDANEASDSEEEDEDYEDYDLPPGIEDIAMEGDEDSEEDELDALEDAARVEEIDTDEEEVPKLVKNGNKKRPAEDDAEVNGLDEMIAKEAKLSKKQAKKLKNNEGKAVATATPAAAKDAVKAEDAAKGEKKVQFAKNLEQGPTGSTAGAADPRKATLGVKIVQGVTIDDRKLGTGRIVKKGDRVSMRYIGKLADNNKVFDSNKKGPGFQFKVGAGEVIKGWDIGIAGMAVKGERRLTIPANLAYGKQGQPGIPANSTLVFDVKLLEIK